MKELVIVSGKGGTGKTSISAAIAFQFQRKVLVDCDVDAANLHLLSDPTICETHEFKAGFEPHIDEKACSRCGICTALCRFDAITAGVITSPLDCEGCGVCAFHCPEPAIAMHEKAAGHWFVSDTRLGRLVHAELGLAIESSGKLVSKIRREGRKIAETQKLPLVIIDGPPGIGCPAIAAMSGTSYVLAVIEPSLSSMHDLERLAHLVTHFQLPMGVCINKSTLNPDNVQSIISWCQTKNIPVLAQIPYCDAFRTAVQSGQTVLDLAENDAQEPLRELWKNLASALEIPIQPPEGTPFWRKLNIFR